MNTICPTFRMIMLFPLSAPKNKPDNTKQQAKCSLFAYPSLVLLLNLEDRSSALLQNVREHLADYIASYPQKELFIVVVERTAKLT
jgi:hypothetical protein